MKFSGFSLAFIAAVAAPSVGASDASASSLRGRGHDKDSSIMTPTRLLKPDPDLLPAQANTDMPELPSKAQANVNANGKENGRPFGNAATTTTTTSTTTSSTTTTTTTSPCPWPLDTTFCWEDDPTSRFVLNVCPTEDLAVDTVVGSNLSVIAPVKMNTFVSDTEFISSVNVVYNLLDSGDVDVAGGNIFSATACA